MPFLVDSLTMELSRQLHGERVHEERHVVDDDLDDLVRVCRPAVLGQTVGVNTRTCAVPWGRLVASL